MRFNHAPGATLSSRQEPTPPDPPTSRGIAPRGSPEDSPTLRAAARARSLSGFSLAAEGGRGGAGGAGALIYPDLTARTMPTRGCMWQGLCPPLPSPYFVPPPLLRLTPSPTSPLPCPLQPRLAELRLRAPRLVPAGTAEELWQPSSLPGSADPSAGGSPPLQQPSDFIPLFIFSPLE